MEIVGNPNLMTHANVNAKPVEAWNMVQRQSMYKKYRITKVDHHLFSDSVAKQAGAGLAMASFVDPCDKTHAMVIKNAMQQTLPPIPNEVDGTDAQKRKFLTWLSNQSNTKRLKFGGSAPLNEKWSMKPMVNQEQELFPENQGGAMISTKVQKRFPWLDFERDLNKSMSVGNCDLYFPILEIMPIIPNLDVSNPRTRQLLVMAYAPMLQTTIHWQCTGKWIDSDYVEAYQRKLEEDLNRDPTGLIAMSHSRPTEEDIEVEDLSIKMENMSIE